MIRLLRLSLFCTTIFIFQNCGLTGEKPATTALSVATPMTVPALIGPVGFDDYWYQGKAELSTYAVTQERYGEERPAEQVNIFVTEDFSRQRQVKLDDPAQAGADRVPVLKLNSVRRFHTGIYDYSVLQSVFTPVDGTPALKVTSTVQDWCGHVFTQFNLNQQEYHIRQFSYFEGEGDSDLRLPLILLEDDLWMQLRIHPEQIRLGKVQILPATLYLRFRHQPFMAHTATLTMEKGERENTLHVVYEDIPRSLAVRFEPISPYRILGWEEIDKGQLMSKGTLKTVRLEPYWMQHDNKFNGMRDSLQVHF